MAERRREPGQVADEPARVGEQGAASSVPVASTGAGRGARAGRVVGVVVLAGVSLVIALTLAQPLFGTPEEVRQRAVAFDVLGDDVRVVWQVDRPADLDVVCVVRARAEDGREVGRAEVPVPAGRSRVRVEYVLRTTGDPVTGELVDCGAPDDGA